MKQWQVCDLGCNEIMYVCKKLHNSILSLYIFLIHLSSHVYNNAFCYLISLRDTKINPFAFVGNTSVLLCYLSDSVNKKTKTTCWIIIRSGQRTCGCGDLIHIKWLDSTCMIQLLLTRAKGKVKIHFVTHLYFAAMIIRTISVKIGNSIW